MEHEFWHNKWKNGEIGFHQPSPNELLVNHFSRLGLQPGARFFLPLCGKSVDIHWLLEQNCRVAGAELSETAVAELFDELGLRPEIVEMDALKRYRAAELEVFVGDLFCLAGHTLGGVDAIYDRAAMVALPPDTRSRYAAHLKSISDTAPQLLITFLYDQTSMEGPPFSIAPVEIERHYLAAYRNEELESRPVEGKLKGEVEAVETIWALLRETEKN